MLNPYVIIIALVGAIGLFGSGVSIGVKWERRDALANLTAVQNKAIEDANTAVEVAIQRTVASAKKEANARLTARAIRHKGELDAALKSRPECSRDAESIGLLNDAINSANGETPTPDKLPDTVRTATDAGGWFGYIRSKLGVQPDRDSGPVPETSRGLRGVEQ